MMAARRDAVAAKIAEATRFEARIDFRHYELATISRASGTTMESAKPALLAAMTSFSTSRPGSHLPFRTRLILPGLMLYLLALPAGSFAGEQTANPGAPSSSNQPQPVAPEDLPSPSHRGKTPDSVLPGAPPEPVFSGIQSDPSSIVLVEQLSHVPRPAAPPPPPKYAAARLPVNIAPRDSLAAMAKDGRKEEIAPLVFAALARDVSRAATDKKWNPDLSIDGAAAIAKDLNLKAEILRAAGVEGGPPPDFPSFPSDYDRRRTIAMLQYKLGKGEAALPALPALRELHRERPRDLTAGLALIRNLPEDDLAHWIALMEDGAVSLDDALLLFVSEVREPYGDPTSDHSIRNTYPRTALSPRAIRIVGSLASYLSHLEPSSGQRTFLDWINLWAAYEWHRCDWGRDSPYPGYDSDLPQLKALAVAMLRHPQTCLAGLKVLQAHANLFESNDTSPSQKADEWLTAALRTRLRCWDWPGFFSTSIRDTHSPSPSPPHDDVAIPYFAGVYRVPREQDTDEILYLAARRAASGAPSLIPSPAIADLLGNGSPAADAPFRRLLEIAGDSSLRPFQEWQQDTSTTTDQRRRQTSALLLLGVMEGREDLLAAVQDEIAAQLTRENPEDREKWAYPLLAAGILAHPALEQRDQAMRRIAAGVLGPEESWPEYAKSGPKHDQAATWRSYRFLSIRNELAILSPIGAMAFARFLEASDLEQTFGAEEPVRFRDPTDADLIRNSGILANDASLLAARLLYFRSVLSAQRNGIEEWHPGGSVTYKSWDPDFLTKIEGPQRMWARLAYANCYGNVTMAVSEMNLNLPAMKKWPAKARHDFAIFINYLFPTAADAAPKELKEFLQVSS